MTPEQVERLEEMTLFGDRGLAGYRDRSDIRALLAEWEERGREVERLRASTLPDVVPEDVDALRDEVARLRHEIERRKAEVARLEDSMVRHFQEEHLAGDGPEIDRWKARVEELEAGQDDFRAALHRSRDRAEAAEAKLAVWGAAESLPDCPACAALAAAKGE